MAQDARLPSGRKLKVALIEVRPRVFRALEERVAATYEAGPSLLLRCGDWTEHFDAVRRLAGPGPILTFLDPFGVSGLDASHYPKLLAGARDEVFVLASGVGASRHHGVLVANADARRARLDARRQELWLLDSDQELHDQELVEDLGSIEEYERMLEPQQESSRAVLLRALGSVTRVDAILGAPRRSLPSVFVGQLAGALLDAGAERVLSIPLRDEQGRYKYSLLHASKSPAALLAMKREVDTELRKEGLDANMRARICDDLRIDVKELANDVERAFADQSYPWAQKVSGSLQDFLLVETEIFPFQMQQLKHELKQRGLLKKVSGSERFVGPALSGSD